MCLTFGRPQRILEEAVYSFLNQDYPGPKELLILNDFTQQTIVFDHPQVTVVNLAERFRTVGEKRNAAAARCRHDLLAVWDDDDIYLPHRLSFSVSQYDEQRRFFKPTWAFVLNDGVISGPSEYLFHSGSMWHRSLFDEVGGYVHMGSGEDADIEARFKKVIGPGMYYGLIQPCEIYYLYRWSGTESYHLSFFGRDRPDRSGSNKVMEFVLDQLERGIIRPGEIALQPQWSVDYAQLVKDYVATL
jgi:glycosyltransferase involved in cell wall biosynthesis